MHVSVISDSTVAMNRMIHALDLLEFHVMMESIVMVKTFVLEQVQLEMTWLELQERVDILEILAPMQQFAMDLAMKQLKVVH